MYRFNHFTFPFFFTLILVASLIYPASAVAETCNVKIANLESLEGSVKVQRAGQAEWEDLQPKAALCEGDLMRVYKNSRASVRLFNNTVLRLDQSTTVLFPYLEKAEKSLIDILRGAIYFFSRYPKRHRVLTPFVNAAVEGTEFLVKVSEKQTRITLFEGQILASNAYGEKRLTKGDSLVASKDQAPAAYTMVNPRDAVKWALYYPSIGEFTRNMGSTLSPDVQTSRVLWKQGKPNQALEALLTLSPSEASASDLLYRARLFLSVGRVDEALADIASVDQTRPDNSSAMALRALIHIVQNQKEDAMALAEKAVAANQNDPSAHMALSYSQQAYFDLEGALESCQKAVGSDADNALAWARISELQLSVGNLDKALKAAHKAKTLNPRLARTQTVLGFAYLTQIETNSAIEAFNAAIQLDQSAPLPRLGLGLAKIRQGDLKAGRSNIEVAVSLDPGNALIRSYLGKAYFEEKRDPHTASQLDMAKELDPLDPTPWFYDAIRKQTQNRPVEALHDLHKSIELNDNRAVYRSRLMLDEDLAARSASLGRIYNDLGFQQLALVEGWKSVNTDPSNYSAHRFLADSYAARPRHEIARVSELLQSQLLQPINTTPIQPQLAESQLGVINDTSLSDPSFNEFTSLFNRNRLSFQANGIMGGNSTFGDDLVLSGLYGKNSFNIGQFHYESDGFRENNNQEKDIYTVFYQTKPWNHTSLLAEYRMEESKFGDLPLRFNPEIFYPGDRNKEESDSIRFGIKHSLSSRSDIIATAIYEKTEASLINELDGFGFNLATEGYMAEVQHLLRTESINIITGIGHFDADVETTLAFSPDPPIEDSTHHTNIYLYGHIDFPTNVTWTLGGSADFYDGIEENELFSPKLGLTWIPHESTTIRAAAFRILSKSVIADQTIEPTQVSGFNQFFNDFEGDDIWRYGIAIDHKFTKHLFGGVELSKRDIETSYFDFDMILQKSDWEEHSTRIYLYWTPENWLSVNIDYQYEQFRRVLENTGEEQVHELDTHKIPISVKAFCPWGLITEVKSTYVDQKGVFDYNFGVDPENGADQFWNTDVSISYRLPRRFGLFSIEVRNIFDEKFQFQFMDKARPEFSPERLFLFNLRLLL